MAQRIYGTCVKCGGSGVCQPCRGSGRSGFFLELSEDLKPCLWCQGSACCGLCGGSGKMAVFEPYIYVEHSLPRPVSITLAAFSGALWRFIGIPDEALSLGEDGLLAWAAVRVRKHYRQEGGKCPLFGDITGYQLVRVPGVGVRLDTEGRYVETTREEFAPTTTSIQFRNKTLEVPRGGMWRVDAAREKP